MSHLGILLRGNISGNRRDHHSQGDSDGLMSLLFIGLPFGLQSSVSRSPLVKTGSISSSEFGSGKISDHK